MILQNDRHSVVNPGHPLIRFSGHYREGRDWTSLGSRLLPVAKQSCHRQKVPIAPRYVKGLFLTSEAQPLIESFCGNNAAPFQKSMLEAWPLSQGFCLGIEC